MSRYANPLGRAMCYIILVCVALIHANSCDGERSGPVESGDAAGGQLDASGSTLPADVPAGTQSTVPAADAIYVSFAPEHLSTDVGASPILVRLAREGSLLVAEEVASVLDSVIVTAGGGQPEALQYADLQGAVAQATDNMGIVEIVATNASLASESGWLEVRLPALDSIGVAVHPSVRQGDDARSLFRRDPYPTVVSVDTRLPQPSEFDGQPAGAAVYIQLSEMIDVTSADGAVLVTVEGLEQPCVRSTNPNQVGTLVDRLDFDCGNEVGLGAPATISFSDVPAVSAPFVRDLAGSAHFQVMTAFSDSEQNPYRLLRL